MYMNGCAKIKQGPLSRPEIAFFSRCCTAVLIGWDLWLRVRTPPTPPHLGSYTRALLVSQDRRRLFFVTPWNNSCTHFSLAETPKLPPYTHLGSYTRALLASQDRRRLFVTPWNNSSTVHASVTATLPCIGHSRGEGWRSSHKWRHCKQHPLHSQQGRNSYLPPLPPLTLYILSTYISHVLGCSDM